MYFYISNNENIKIHSSWYKEILNNNTNINKENIDKIIEDEVGNVFKKVLEHCGVFKWNDEGIEAINRYITSLKNNIK